MSPKHQGPIPVVDYSALSQQDFDAIVTGELTHYAIWHEAAIEDFIAECFCFPQAMGTFKTLIMRREGFTAQNKIEIAKSIIDQLGLPDEAQKYWKQLLEKVDNFKSYRNILAHGVDITPTPYVGELHIETISRSGKSRVMIITQEKHQELLGEGEKILEELRKTTALLKMASR